MSTYGLKRCKRLKGDARDEALIRHCLKHWRNFREARPIVSLMEGKHYLADMTGDGYTEYWIEDCWKDKDDEEIRQYCKDMRIRIDSPYDCTGKYFTLLLYYHRMDSGLVSFFHYLRRDV